RHMKMLGDDGRPQSAPANGKHGSRGQRPSSGSTSRGSRPSSAKDSRSKHIRPSSAPTTTTTQRQLDATQPPQPRLTKLSPTSISMISSEEATIVRAYFRKKILHADTETDISHFQLLQQGSPTELTGWNPKDYSVQNFIQDYLVSIKNEERQLAMLAARKNDSTMSSVTGSTTDVRFLGISGGQKQKSAVNIGAMGGVGGGSEKQLHHGATRTGNLSVSHGHSQHLTPHGHTSASATGQHGHAPSHSNATTTSSHQLEKLAFYRSLKKPPFNRTPADLKRIFKHLRPLKGF
ncbi:hypothetical protein HDU76_012184, partial [Blyttiomyces sp. JEL0837]